MHMLCRSFTDVLVFIPSPNVHEMVLCETVSSLIVTNHITNCRPLLSVTVETWWHSTGQKRCKLNQLESPVFYFKQFKHLDVNLNLNIKMNIFYNLNVIQWSFTFSGAFSGDFSSSSLKLFNKANNTRQKYLDTFSLLFFLIPKRCDVKEQTPAININPKFKCDSKSEKNKQQPCDLTCIVVQ